MLISKSNISLLQTGSTFKTQHQPEADKLKILQILRPLNLLMVAVLMYLVRYGIVIPICLKHKLEVQFSESYFFLLVVSVILLTAGGYIINDFYDIEADKINKPEKTFVGKSISKKTAYIGYFLTTLMGLALGIFLAIKMKVTEVIIIQVIATFGLWLYAIALKKKLLIGNLIVSFISALVPVAVLAFNLSEITYYTHNQFIELTSANLFSELFYWIIGFSFFVFLVTLIREIQKDMADVEGDKLIRASSLPIRFGFAITQRIVAVLVIFLAFSMVLAWLIFLKQEIVSLVYLSFVLLFMGLGVLKTTQGNSASEFLKAATYTKAAMAIAIAYLPALHFLIKQNAF